MSESERQKHVVLLREATAQVRKYCQEVKLPPAPSDQDLRAALEHDLSSNPVVFDVDGYTASAANMLQSPIRQILTGLASSRRAFDDAFKFFEADLNRKDEVHTVISEIKQHCDAEIEAEREKFNAQEDVITRNLAKSQYEEIKQRHAGDPNLRAVNVSFPAGISPLYLLLLFLVGVAEFFINYKLIEVFLGIPLAAFASAAVMAAVLAAISHVHGVDLKQFQHKFGQATRPNERPWQTFALAWIGLIVLLLVVGWMRYEAVSSEIQASSSSSVFLPQSGSMPNLGEEVIISLGANLLAWFLGVFLAASFHDSDPDYVDAAVRLERAERKCKRLFRKFEHECDRIAADARKKIAEQQYVQKRLEADPILQEAEQARGQIEALTSNIHEQVRAFLAEQGLRYKVSLLQRISNMPDIIVCRRDAGGGLRQVERSDLATMQIGTDDKLLERIAFRG